VIRNGIDLALAGPDGPLPRLPAAGRFILSAGALDHVKGHDVLIRAWARVQGALPDTALIIAGEGDREDFLRALAAELGCGERVVFTGKLQRATLLATMRAAALFVLPSRNEGLGLVLLEAGLAGCPVVASDVGGVGEIVTRGETGWLVRPDDPAELAAAIRQALGDAGLRARLAKGLASRVRTRFGSAAMADAYLELYREAARR
jgi:glycosyltransferase involved in cell wall biosynthesis